MKTLLALVLTLGTLGAFAQNKPLPSVATTYTVDTTASSVAWIGKKVTGQHNGHLKIKSGNLVFAGDVLTGGEILVDMNSLTVEDITDTEASVKFVGHVKSDDFFATEKFPEAKILIKSSKKTTKGLEVKGDLTIKGITLPVNFLAQVKNAGNKAEGKATLIIDRTKYDLKYGSGKFFEGLGDKMIHDEFTLSVNIIATK